MTDRTPIKNFRLKNYGINYIQNKEEITRAYWKMHHKIWKRKYKNSSFYSFYNIVEQPNTLKTNYKENSKLYPLPKIIHLWIEIFPDILHDTLKSIPYKWMEILSDTLHDIKFNNLTFMRRS